MELVPLVREYHVVGRGGYGRKVPHNLGVVQEASERRDGDHPACIDDGRAGRERESETSMTESAYELFDRGRRFLATGHPHQAVVALERAAAEEPDKGSIREALGRALFLTGRWTAARAQFAKAVDIDPVNHYAHFALGLACERTGERTRALAHLKLAVAMEPLDEYREALDRLSA